MKTILQKYIAESGHCSRRKAEELIRGGKVVVNDKVAELGQKVDSRDKVVIGNKKIELLKKKYIILNKPTGYTCTKRSFKDEENVYELMPREYHNLNIVGRLDKDSEGLVILTNDGDWAYEMTHPKFEHEKEYEVEVRSNKLEVKKIIEKFRKGFVEKDGILKAKFTEYLGENIFKVILTQGKKRQIRRMFARTGCDVLNLKRVRIEDINLENLKTGEFTEFNLKS